MVRHLRVLLRPAGKSFRSVACTTYGMRTSFIVAIILIAQSAFAAAAVPSRPNVLLILTDDQGWGDLGVNGNEKIHTPNIDRFAREAVRFTRFYAEPVCTPTRAGLMTGRYHFRTRAIDTWCGRAIMHPDETTIAEVLAAAGYRTGIFGKWHLGDHFPSRPIDQGFSTSLVHAGGGISQPSDPPGGSSYFDPWLERDGKPVQAKGYCSDVFANAAIEFIESSAAKRQPFFAYLAFNAPHVPLQVAKELVEPYRAAGLDGPTAKLYAMVTNIDDNVARVLSTLDKHELTRDTIVIFMSDNGPHGDRFNGVLRGGKGTVYEGGIRVPFFIRWPAGFKGDREVDRIAAHIDVMPTILSACGAAAPANVKLDGRDLLPLMRDDTSAKTWPDRTLYLQWHRGDAPDAGRNCAAVTQRYKLLQPMGMADGPPPRNPKWALYDLHDDPSEKNDVSADHADVASAMRHDYDAWFADVTSTRGFDPVPIHIGSDRENPVLLTRNDRRGGTNGDAKQTGFWVLRVDRAASFDITLMCQSADEARDVSLQIGDAPLTTMMPVGATEHTFTNVRLPAGETRLEAKSPGITYVRIEGK